MDAVSIAAAAFAGTATLVHVASALMAVKRCRTRGRRDSTGSRDVAGHSAVPVSIIRPLCGLDAYESQTMRSAFRLAHENYEVILCVASPTDPVIPLAEEVMRAHPSVPSRLLVGDDPISQNPKLNNVVKGWRAARHPWVVIVDSNVTMPSDYISRLLGTWQEDTGLVCSPPIGALPEGFAAELECAFLNTYQARWQYAADTIGLGFAQGKTMLWHRDDLERAGGIATLAAEVAEDAAATKIVRSLGRRVRLVDQPFLQPLGTRTLAQVWSRQLRWARLRRASFPLYHAPEILTGLTLPLAAAMFAAPALDLPVAGVAAAMLTLWLGAEARLAASAGWHVDWRSPVTWLLRDLMLPVLWVLALSGRAFTWRGNAMVAGPEPALRSSSEQATVNR